MKYINRDYADKSWFKGQRETPQAFLVTLAVILILIFLDV